MSDVRLIVREAACDWSGTIHGSFADRAIAALSADPVTLEELEAAFARFVKPSPKRRFLGNLRRGLCDKPYDAGLVVLDLAAKLVVVDSNYSSPAREGTVEYHNGRWCTSVALRYHLADDWLFVSDCGDWQALAENRRRSRADAPIRDVRDVFYGLPLLEFIGRQLYAVFAESNDVSQLSFDETVKEIHARWLLTPRDDLGGACPRDVALEHRHHLSMDLQHRAEQWTRQGECPPGLAETSHAFRYGGFGTHELVKYYDLVRELLWSCCARLEETCHRPDVERISDAFTVDDFLSTEIPRLESIRDTWLDSPDPECHGRTPRSLITRERARLPEGLNGHEAVIDPDCPCCQMMADMPGPVFFGLDGSEMDDDFAFDIWHRTLADWEEEQRKWDDFNECFNAEQEERERLGLTNRSSSRSFVVDNIGDLPSDARLFAIGCRLAELVVALRPGVDGKPTCSEAQPLIDELNRDFGNLREILQNADSSLREALIDPILHRFRDTLDTVAGARPDLASLCEQLTNDLDTFLNPPAEIEEFPDSDMPF
jgi:hypothetical protein